MTVNSTDLHLNNKTHIEHMFTNISFKDNMIDSLVVLNDTTILSIKALSSETFKCVAREWIDTQPVVKIPTKNPCIVTKEYWREKNRQYLFFAESFEPRLSATALVQSPSQASQSSSASSSSATSPAVNSTPLISLFVIDGVAYPSRYNLTNQLKDLINHVAFNVIHRWDSFFQKKARDYRCSLPGQEVVFTVTIPIPPQLERLFKDINHKCALPTCIERSIAKKLTPCSKCHTVEYCSAKHEEEDRGRHKEECISTVTNDKGKDSSEKAAAKESKS